jgi:hypothetical protein
MFLFDQLTGVVQAQLPAGMLTCVPSVAASMAAWTSGCEQLFALIVVAANAVDPCKNVATTSDVKVVRMVARLMVPLSAALHDAAECLIVKSHNSRMDAEGHQSQTMCPASCANFRTGDCSLSLFDDESR